MGRNEPCPCKSGKKFKKCHLRMVEALLPRGVRSKGFDLYPSLVAFAVKRVTEPNGS